jgi:hypothetical protein
MKTINVLLLALAICTIPTVLKAEFDSFDAQTQRELLDQTKKQTVLLQHIDQIVTAINHGDGYIPPQRRGL